MVTDLGGFAGATFKRGIHTLNIPTTLMGAVDAAAGGKTGVNFYGLKNEIGAFHAPERVIVCPLFFRSLDSRNFYSGYAEMLKHALLSNAALYVRTLAFDRVSEGDGGNDFDSLLADSVAVKEEIVAADPHEHDIRKALNLGHTVGHAIESLSFKRGQALLHGEAVAVGLVCELYLSHIRLGFPLTELRRLTGFVREHYPLFVYGCNEYETLYGFMTHDKKNVSDKINFSLLAGIGDIRIDSSASREEIYEALDFYRETL
jgi:3-dehydroquinate synthase